MRLHMLGVSGPWPVSGGATSGYLLEAADRVLQFDFGSGVLSRLTAVFPPEELDALFLSHWHFDHVCDVLPLIYRLEAMKRVLPVYAPEDEGSEIRRIVSRASCFDLHVLAPGAEVSLGEVRVLAGPARHPVPGLGFRVEAEGRIFGYTGDTNTHPGLKDFYQGCDLLLADGLFPASEWTEQKPHLSAALAAGLAVDAGVKQLVLTHLNPVFSPQILRREAWEVFSAVETAEAGAVLTL